jgi:hypothetical protein
VVVGVDSEDMGGAIGALHIVTTVDGLTDHDVTIAPSALPFGIQVLPPAADAGVSSGAPDAGGARVGVQVDGYPASGTSASAVPALLHRSAETSFVPGETALLRVHLQSACLLGLPGGPPGAPDCTAPLTCIGGACQDDTVPPASLEVYTPGWATSAPDACGPAGSGLPAVQVGTGQSAYLPLTDGQTVRMEEGPQGGHHIWIAVRQQNLRQAGSTTTITSVQPTTGLAGPHAAYVFTFAPDQGGFCVLYGLRYQLDADGTDYHQFLGQPLDVTVTIADGAGRTASGVAHIQIDSQLVCLSGDSGC